MTIIIIIIIIIVFAVCAVIRLNNENTDNSVGLRRTVCRRRRRRLPNARGVALPPRFQTRSGVGNTMEIRA